MTYPSSSSGRVTKEMISRIKSGTDMLGLCNRLGIELKKQGHGYMGHCPFHKDKTPSLSVNTSKGLFHCFGCGEKGDAVALVEKVRGVGFQEALAFLADLAGIDAGAGAAKSLSAAALEAPKRELEVRPEVVHAFSEKEKQEALSRVVSIYESNLASSTDAEEYLKKSRGITDNQVIRFFRVGFSNGNLEKRVAADSRQYHLLRELGVFNEQGREVFRGCLVFPVVSGDGRVTELYARSIRDTSRVKHLYLKGPHAGVWNERAFKVYDSVILCEGIIDALSLFQQGFKNVSCLYGLNGFTEELKETIRKQEIKKLYFALDNEERAKEKAAEYAAFFPFLTSKWIQLPDGVKDVNEYVAVRGYKQEHFKELLLTSSLLALAEGAPFDTEEQLADGAVGVAFCFEEYLVEAKGIPVKGVKAPLKVGLKVRYNATGQVQYDTVDLFSSRSRSMFVNNTAGLFGVTREDLDAHLVQILSFIEKRDRERVHEKERGQTAEVRPRELTEEEKKLGLRLLKNRHLFKEIIRDMTTMGYIGEDRNKLLAYLVGTSRKMEDPLAAIIVSRSSAGKSRLVDTVQTLIPPEDVLSITTASDQSFFYFKDGGLSHKLICMGEHHGMENIEYHIRELLSAKEISKVVSMKNEEGQIETITLTVRGPIAYFMTSTNPDLNEENLSRCLILYIDESEAQTRKILEYQRMARTKRGYRSPRLLGGIRKKHRIAQRMLKKVVVRIPFANQLDFPIRKLDARRDQMKFLNLIDIIAFMHQYQREEKVIQEDGREVAYIEATVQDYKLAFELFMHGTLQNTLSDLPKMARDLHKGILSLRKKVAKAEGRKEKDVLFTRKMLVDHTGFSFVQVRNYIRALEEYEIIEVAGGYQNGQKKVYRLVAEILEEINLSMIPTPEELEKKLRESQS